MGGGAAQSKEGFAQKGKHLSPHQVEHRRADSLDPSPLPGLDGIGGQQVIVFVVAGDKQGGEGLGFQPIQPILFLLGAVPHPAEIPQDHHTVLFGHLLLFRKDIGAEAGKVAVGVAGEKEHQRSLLGMVKRAKRMRVL